MKEKKILKEAETDERETITEKAVQTDIKGIKNNKAGDRFGWKAEWIKRLAAIYNKLQEERKIPAQWRYIIIKQ